MSPRVPFGPMGPAVPMTPLDPEGPRGPGGPVLPEEPANRRSTLLPQQPPPEKFLHSFFLLAYSFTHSLTQSLSH